MSIMPNSGVKKNYIVIETMLDRENSVQGPLLLKLPFVGLKKCLHLSQQNTLHIVIFIVSPSKLP